MTTSSPWIRICIAYEAIPLNNAISVSAAAEIGRFLKNRLADAVLLGPDSESSQWVEGIAEAIGFDYAIAEKIRRGDQNVEITLPDSDYQNKPVIIIDDIASTGRTLANTVRLLKQAGAGEVYAAVTHALFCGDAEAHLRSAGVKAIWSTDSILHPTSCIKLDALLAETIKSVL